MIHRVTGCSDYFSFGTGMPWLPIMANVCHDLTPVVPVQPLLLAFHDEREAPFSISGVGRASSADLENENP